MLLCPMSLEQNENFHRQSHKRNNADDYEIKIQHRQDFRIVQATLDGHQQEDRKCPSIQYYLQVQKIQKEKANELGTGDQLEKTEILEKAKEKAVKHNADQLVEELYKKVWAEVDRQMFLDKALDQRRHTLGAEVAKAVEAAKEKGLLPNSDNAHTETSVK